MLRSDLPLDRNTAGLFLPVIIGFMVFLAALAFAGGMAVDNLLVHWRGAIEAAFTVQLPPVEGEDAAATASRRNHALGALAGVPGIAGASLLSEADKARLLAPWLGADSGRLDLPLPDLIAVTTVPGSSIDMTALAGRLQAVSPGALIDDHSRWRAAVTKATHVANLALLGLLLLIGLAASLTVVFVARAGLASHRRVIDILHLIGAHDGYVAGQFQRHALTRGLLGGTLGAAAAAGVFLAAERWLPGLGAAELALGPGQWAALALLPIIAALLAMASARYTVLRSLRRIL
jgi:cell division transport system permease protein